jgi:Ca2+-transporting ATPase
VRRQYPLDRQIDLRTDGEGLALDEVGRRRSLYGGNNIVEAAPAGWRQILRDTLTDPMIWFLLVTSGLFVAIGDRLEAVIMLAAILPLLGMDVFLHQRTQASTTGLRSRLTNFALVVRSGAESKVPAVSLVPGDLVLVAPGEPFPADGIIVGGDGLQADEAALTGEAFPVRKRALADSEAAQSMIDGVHWGFAGSRLLTGTAHVRVIFTGRETLYGEIVRSAVEGAHGRTPLQLAIGQLVKILVIASAILCVALAWIRVRQGFGIVDGLLSAVTLAVAAIPEEFPVVFTFFLGVGVYRLARRQALVRRGVVVENIGRITCICSDKTGTLTEGVLSLRHVVPASGHNEQGVMAVAALASRADSGDPLDAAILDRVPSAPDKRRLATYPFTEDRLREAAVFDDDAGQVLIAVKGAPEAILGLCHLTESERRDWMAKVGEFAGTAHKVIACAELRMATDRWLGGEPERGYGFAGLLAFEDPVRDGAADAVSMAREAGIHVIMVTGDHPATAAAVAVELGIGGERPVVLDGDELDRLLAEGNGETLQSVDVIARAVPSQKLTLVKALQARGEIVAVTGDGVNDVPALQAADIGIAMGERGTRSAREVASIVLLDDNFRTIINAISEGGQLYRNLRLSFTYLLMIHFPLVLSAAIIPLAGYPLLLLPIHIVWLELIIHPTALLAFQEDSTDGSLRRTREAGFFGWRQWLIIGVVSLLLTLLVLVGYDAGLGEYHDVDHARSLAVVVLVIGSAGITAALSGLRTRAACWVIFVSLASLVLFVQVPQIGRLLNLTPLHLDDWLMAVFATLAVTSIAWLMRMRVAERATPRR